MSTTPSSDYGRAVAHVERYFISTSGQVPLPAAARQRWGLTEGGPVDVLDLGFGVMTLPAREVSALLDDLLSADAHRSFVADLHDPSLATT